VIETPKTLTMVRRFSISVVPLAFLLLISCSGTDPLQQRPSSDVPHAQALADDMSAKAVLRNGLVAAKTYFTDDDVYSGFRPSVGRSIEPSIDWLDDHPATVGAVSINLVRSGQVVLSTLSESGQAFCLADDLSTHITTFGTNDAFGSTSVADCNGTADGWT
jgi:hypothetical protein